MRHFFGILILLGLCGCSVKKNNFFSRSYHQLTTCYNVYFNGDQALKSGVKTMENRHKEDYTALLPVFVSNNEQTRLSCVSDMDYAIEKAIKAIDKHSITTKPRRRKNKDSKSYQTFRKKKEFNNQLDKCYLLLGKAYFYKKKYAMANRTFRFIQRQYAEDQELQTETAIWLFRSLTEMERYDEAAQWMNYLEGVEVKRKHQELVAAARTDFYVRQNMYAEAVSEAEKLVGYCKNMKRKPRYNFILSQLYLKLNQETLAQSALKKSMRFNFNYEMIFNAKVNMALAYGGDEFIEKKLKKMLKDSRNEDFQDRIYYALGNIEEKRGEEHKAIELYWKSVRSSVNHDNQQALSFRKLGDFYFKEKNYIKAQSCYDSCMYVIDSRHEDYEQLKVLLSDLTLLTHHLSTIQLQDSLLHLAALPETERYQIIDRKIQEIKDREALEREQTQQAMRERYFYERNNMLGERNDHGEEWYFYNPITIAMGKNEFKRKWGRRKLEDDWRRQNKIMVNFADDQELWFGENESEPGEKDIKSRAYYLQNLPMTEEEKELAMEKVQEAYYGAGELYMYKFHDPEKALECYETYIRRFSEHANLPMIYYLAYTAAVENGKPIVAETYKQELIRRFPENDFALSLQDAQYFQKIEDILNVVEDLYEQAYSHYEQAYYWEARKICDEVLQKYPNNKLTANVLFLKAMCILNTASEQEGKKALEQVLNAKPSQEIKTMIGNILASLSMGSKPVMYTTEDMDRIRYLQANRNWRFDEEVIAGETHRELTTYQFSTNKEQMLMILLPEDFNLTEEMRFQARLTFMNASEAAEGRSYELKKEELWYKREALMVGHFKNTQEALAYFNRVSTDKHLLKMIGERTYRMFIIDSTNLNVLKRVRKVENYLDFFTENYFEDRYQGEVMSGKYGITAHVFNQEENMTHHFVLAVPFREVNTKRLAEELRLIDPAFALIKEDYDHRMELIVVKNIGVKAQALDYMNVVLGNKEIFEHLTGIDYEAFVITEQNLKAMRENDYLVEYIRFFGDHYLKTEGAIGVEDGEYVYNKNVAHQFVLIYPNTVDPFKLKAVFEEFNFSGLSLNNQKFDAENDYMLVSGLNNKEEAMRYFNTVLSHRKLFRPLRNIDYVNFIITEVNLQTLLEKKVIENYIGFFRKYYLD